MPDLFGGIGDLLSAQDDWLGSLTDATSTVGDTIGNSLSGGIDWGSTTPFDAITAGGGPSITSADIFSNVPGLVSTPDYLSSITDLSGMFGGAGGGIGSVGAGLSKVLPTALKLAGGGGGGGTPTQPRPGTPSIPGLVSGGGTTPSPAAPGGGIGGVLGGILSNPATAALAGLIPAAFSAISSKDQTNLGPDAEAMRKLATGNQDTINSLQAEAQAEKMGNLPGPALASLEASLQQQRAGLLTRYNAMGMSGSSAEAADMAALNQQNEFQRFQIGMNMANESLSQVSGLTQQDVGIYQNLMDAQTQRDKEYMDAMATLAAGIGKAFSQFGAPSVPGTTPAGGTPQTPPAATDTGLPPGLTSTPINPADLTGLVPMDAITAPNIVGDFTLPQTNVPDLTTFNPPTNIDTTPQNPGISDMENALNNWLAALG